MLRERDTLYRGYKRTGRQNLFEQFVTLQTPRRNELTMPRRLICKPDSRMLCQMVMFEKSCVAWDSCPSIQRIRTGLHWVCLTITLLGYRSLHKTIVRSARELVSTAALRTLLSNPWDLFWSRSTPLRKLYFLAYQFFLFTSLSFSSLVLIVLLIKEAIPSQLSCDLNMAAIMSYLDNSKPTCAATSLVSCSCMGHPIVFFFFI